VLGLLLVVGGLAAIAFAVLAAHRDTGERTTAGRTRCVGEVGTGTPPAGEVPAPPPVAASTRYAKGRTPLCGFREAVLRVTTASGAVQNFCVLDAVTEAQRQRGLMKVRDRSLGGYDGMAFRFDTDQPGGFYMRNTPMPLSISYVDAGHRVVDSYDMAPCADRADCPSYPVAQPFRLAIEVPQGGLKRLGLTPGATAEVEPATVACKAKSP